MLWVDLWQEHNARQATGKQSMEMELLEKKRQQLEDKKRRLEEQEVREQA